MSETSIIIEPNTILTKPVEIITGDFFIAKVPENILAYVRRIVNYSIDNHPVSNKWDKTKKKETRTLRMTGSIGEVMFAWFYGKECPVRAYGAVDGQDYGKDFNHIIDSTIANIDVKSQRRTVPYLDDYYACNISTEQLSRQNLTTHYYSMSIYHTGSYLEGEDVHAYFTGFISKSIITDKNNGIGEFFPPNTKMKNGSKKGADFDDEHYECGLKHLQHLDIEFTKEKIKGNKDIKWNKFRNT